MEGKKKILFAATVVKTHIMEFHVPYLKMLQEMGWETAVASRNDYENPDDCRIPYCDTYYDIPFERSPLKPGNLRAYKMLKKVISEGNYDIIHCHTPVGAILTRLAARRARKQGTKVIYTAHGFHFYKGAPLLNWLIYYPAEWVCSFLTDVLITINREDYALACKRMHAGRTEYVRGVGIDLNRFGNHSAERDDIRRELGLSENDFVLLSVAELTPNKNHESMVRAIARIPDSRLKLICAGRGERMEYITGLIQELNLEKRVQMLGYRNDVSRLYGAADAFLFPSFREGLSVSLMEAMASGLPAIVGAIRGNTDLIDNGVEGIYAPLNPEGLAEAICRLRDDSDLRRRMGTAAREKIQLFGDADVHRKVKEIYLHD